MSGYVYFKNGQIIEHIVPLKEFSGIGVSIDFSSISVESESGKKIYRYVFKHEDFQNLSLTQYNDFAQTLYALCNHFIVNHYFTKKDKDFVFDFNLFNKDGIVLQFSVVGLISKLELEEIKLEFVDVFYAALKIHKMHGNGCGNLSAEQEYIVGDFANALEEGVIDKETLNATLLDFIEKYFPSWHD